LPSWQTVATGGGTVNPGAANQLAYYVSTTAAVSPIGSSGTTIQVLHGNPSGTPSFGPVNIADHAAQTGNSLIGNGNSTAGVPQSLLLPANCGDTGGNHLNYVQNLGFSCGTSSSGGGGGGLSGMTAGQVPIAATATTVTSSAPTGTTGNSTIVQTDSGGRIDSAILPGGVTSSGGAISAAQWKNGQLFVGSTSLTLPTTASLAALTPSGIAAQSGITIQAFGGNVVLTPQSGDGINGRAVASPITVPNGITTVCTTSAVAGVNAFTCPLGTIEKYVTSYFSGTDYTAHSVPAYRAGTAVTVAGIVCRRTAAVGGTASINFYSVSNGQIPPGAGTLINSVAFDASGTAGTEQAPLTLVAPSVAAGSWVEMVFSGGGWATNAGAGSCQVSVLPN
jgi:hypothetical protein